jgi:hypothetical protein
VLLLLPQLLQSKACYLPQQQTHLLPLLLQQLSRLLRRSASAAPALAGQLLLLPLQQRVRLPQLPLLRLTPVALQSALSVLLSPKLHAPSRALPVDQWPPSCKTCGIVRKVLRMQQQAIAQMKKMYQAN